MIIRRATQEDRDKAMELLSRVWEDDYVPYVWDDWVSDTASGVPLVAWHDDQLQGVAYVHHLSDSVSWFQALRVDPHARRTGVGSSLAKACLKEAALAGRQSARLLIDADNDASLSMTKQAGFLKVATFLKLKKQLQPKKSEVEFREPSSEHLPTLLKLAKKQGVKFWHSDWETHDLTLATLEQNLANNSLRVPKNLPMDALVAVNCYDDEFEINEPVGAPKAVECLLAEIEQEVMARGIDELEMFICEDSPRLGNYLTSHGFILVKGDGFTIWEHDLTKM